MGKRKGYVFGLAAFLSVIFILQGCGKDRVTGSKEQVPVSLEATEAERDDPGMSDMQEAGRDDSGISDTQEAETEAFVSPATSGALHVEGTQLTDSHGKAVQLRGISTHGLSWFPEYINEECFRQLRQEWNVNVVRLAMYTDEYGGYCSGGDQNALKELVKCGVEYATAQDLYVIIDWHILYDSNPNINLDAAKDFFAEMAEQYGEYDNVLYEICNEPNGDTSWEDIKNYAQEIIPIIRTYDENGIIIVGTPNWSQRVDEAAADPITGYENIMYTLHFYAASHTDSLRNTMIQAVEAGLPVFVTEYGICDSSGNGPINEEQAGQWISAMNEYGISYVAWNLSNKEETSAIIKSTCKKTSGFTAEDLSDSGRWLYQLLTSETQNPLLLLSP